MKRSEIENLLPAVIRRTVQPGTPLLALLEVMEALHAPSEGVLAEAERYFAPHRAPAAFVPYLASWVELDWLLVEGTEGRSAFPAGVGRLRELVASAAYFSKWRGTARGLLRFLETATGMEGFTIEEHVRDEEGHERPFHLRVRAPQEAAAYREMLVRIIEMEKPAYVTYQLIFED